MDVDNGGIEAVFVEKVEHQKGMLPVDLDMFGGWAPALDMLQSNLFVTATQARILTHHPLIAHLTPNQPTACASYHAQNLNDAARQEALASKTFDASRCRTSSTGHDIYVGTYDGLDATLHELPLETTLKWTSARRATTRENLLRA